MRQLPQLLPAGSGYWKEDRMASIAERWSLEWKNPAFRVQSAISFFALLSTLVVLTRFLSHVENREGVTLSDPVLSMIEPRDVTWLTFGLIYAGLVMALIYLSTKPRDLILTVQSYIVMVWFRIGMMWMIPLNAPAGLIVLQDPFVQYVAGGVALTKDLFFSGHTSTMFLLYLVTKVKWLKKMLLGFTMLVAVCVIWQHVHYAVDVAVAPFVSYGAYRIVILMNGRLQISRP